MHVNRRIAGWMQANCPLPNTASVLVLEVGATPPMILLSHVGKDECRGWVQKHKAGLKEREKERGRQFTWSEHNPAMSSMFISSTMGTTMGFFSGITSSQMRR